MSEAGHPPSPCVRNCCLNEQDVCLGCMRTLQEILDWHRMSPQQKQQLLAELPGRHQAARAMVPISEKRCFIGFDVPLAVRHRLHQEAKACREQVGDQSWRWIPYANYHLTLAFLGNQNADRLALLERALASQHWLDQPLALDITGVGGFPDPRRSRYVVANVTLTPKFSELVQALQSVLLAQGFPVEQRPPRPHITLARRKGNSLGTPLPNKVLAGLAFDVQQMALFESRTGPDGSQYSHLALFH